MLHIPDHFRLHFAPRPHDDAVVRIGGARFTLLTSRLIRMEYSPTGTFEDRPSQAFWFREQPVPEYSVSNAGDVLEIRTEYLTLRYDSNTAGFTPENLSVTLKQHIKTWHCGDTDDANLKGTGRTLDGADGAVPLDNGLMSRSGWAVIDDSQTLVFNEDCWLETRDAAPGSIDLYFFGYGSDYTACLRDYSQITGAVPMLPRWALGNWWSRYWNYTDEELIALMQEFKVRDIPLSVCILDMDWHITETGNESDGWTGYTWNRDLFPDPGAFINRLHQLGLRTAMNLHPHAGVHPHEVAYPEMAVRMGIDPASQQPIRFDIADPTFVNAYLELLHHPNEALGVDFWWMDWQQGEASSLPGLDPLWWLNHVHFHDLGRDGHRRPFVFSRWGGFGNHRYPIGFSGDTFVTWGSLAFQPYFTATSANVGYGWWSHDVGGHYRGTEDPELYTRWVQFGVFSPITRLHSSKDQFYDRRPWGFERDDVLRITSDALRLRHELIPYIYSMAWLYHTQHIPLVRPMYHDYPDIEEAYACPQQYTFGTELIAAPFIEPMDPDTGHSRTAIWLPDSEWTHFFSGAAYNGGWHTIYGRLDEIPVFAKAGAIIPLGVDTDWGVTGNPTALDIHVFAGADNSFVLYEDDGVTTAYERGQHCQTTMIQHWQPNRLTFEIKAPTGDVSLLPPQRTYRIHLRSVSEHAQLSIQVNGYEQAFSSRYDPSRETRIVELPPLSVMSEITMSLTAVTGELLAHRDRRYGQCMRLLKHFPIESEIKSLIATHLEEIIAAPEALDRFAYFMTKSQVRALFEITQRVGFHTFKDMGQPIRLVLWNEREDPRMTFRHTQLNTQTWRGEDYIQHEAGIVPRFKVIDPITEDDGPERASWQVNINYFDVFTDTVEQSNR